METTGTILVLSSFYLRRSQFLKLFFENSFVLQSSNLFHTGLVTPYTRVTQNCFFGMAASCQSSPEMLNVFHIIEW